jgi:DNA-binding GntR family transcriptional regulator
MSWDLIHSMSGHYRRFRLITLWDLEIAEDIIKQHQMMLQYIKEKDIEMINKSVQEHVMRILSQKTYMVEKYPSYFQQKMKVIF